MKRAVLAAALAVLCAGAAWAGPIERACNASDRSAATRAMCSCIQRAADATLSRGDQRKAAKFFRNPEAAEKVRSSDSRANDAFWSRYANFAETAEAYCGQPAG
jgi:hypothetical protein